jgi:rhamnosyl/mannosyltransferase
MRVLHYFRLARPDSFGGVEQFIHQLSVATREFGVSSHVLTTSDTPQAATQRLDGHVVHQSRVDFRIAGVEFSSDAAMRFRRMASRFDLIHYHFPWPFADLTHLAFGRRIPSIVTYHSDIVRQPTMLRLYSPLMHAFLGRVDRIVATSPNYVRTSPVLQRHRERVEVIPIGLDVGSYPSPPAARVSELEREHGRRFFLFVGMLRYYKGIHVLLDAVRHTDIPVVIAGGGPLEASLRAQARSPGLSNVRFLGEVSEQDKCALLSLCRAVVQPSHLRSEAFGISLLEGAMFGKPMICCEIGTGTTFINIHGQTGLAVEPADPLSLREAMRRLLDDDAAVERYGAQAAERFRSHFTATRMAASYNALYRRVVDRSEGIGGGSTE